MSKSAARRKAKLRQHRDRAQHRPGQSQPDSGVPEFAPTPERLARGDIRRTLLIERVQDEARDRTGDRPDAQLREVVVGVVRRDLNAFAAERLARFRFLSPVQIEAGARLERDFELSRFEPFLVSDPSRLRRARGGAGSGAQPSETAVDARERLQRARTALRRGGEELVRVVEALVIEGATAEATGKVRYAGQRDALLHVRSHLSIGLALLADHYAAERPRGRPGAALRPAPRCSA